MKRETSVQNLLFDVDQVPVEAVIGTNGHTRRINIPSKKALIHQGTGNVLGVVGRDYRVVTNREAVNLAQEVCGKAFPGLSSVEWEAKRAAAPRTLSYAHIDLMHRTHVLNYMGSDVGQADPYTPFLRVTNSFNGARALRFDVGFMRKHCSARPPEIACFQQTRDTIERRSGRWLKDLASQSQSTGFDLARWLPGWEATRSSKAPTGKN